ncbi:hypothetical protein HDG32_001467 [Paraburkholderia sp. CI2]|nr:hypothetical protein [Paraburkholderia sp. CI2]
MIESIRRVRSTPPRAEQFVERADLLAQRGLRGMQPLRGAAEVEYLRENDEAL